MRYIINILMMIPFNAVPVRISIDNDASLINSLASDEEK